MNDIRSPRYALRAEGDASAALSMIHLPPGELSAPPGNMLAVIRFAERRAEDSAFPSVTIPLAQLDGQDFCECWFGEGPVTSGEEQGVRFSENGQVLFGALHRAEKGGSVDDAAYDAYTSFVRFSRERGYPHLLRIWNHVYAINDELDGLERYKRFSRGRHQALMELGYRFDDDLPAASAIGLTTPGIWIYFVASRTPAVPIENPRQVSAFLYPEQYGPRSPSFSRGAVMEWPGAWQVFLSGTASIVGHETRHRGDVIAQLDETIANMAAVMKKASTVHGQKTHGVEQLTSVKVYLRDRRDLDCVRERLEPQLSPTASILWVEADICRRDLLLEIEGIADIPK